MTTEEEIVVFVLSPFEVSKKRARLLTYRDSIRRDAVANKQSRKP